jgi:NAD(P)-dependent dehydrogenase (short-subunit alcohol dehydrogenase family)
VLVNNAGVGLGRARKLRELSAEGFELRFAVNFLAPFVLTESLVARGSPPRAVVNVASAGQAPLDRGDLMSEHNYDRVLACALHMRRIRITPPPRVESLPERAVTWQAWHSGKPSMRSSKHDSRTMPDLG